MCSKIIQFFKKLFDKKNKNVADFKMERSLMLVNSTNTLLGYFDEFFVVRGIYDFAERDAYIDQCLVDGCVNLAGKRLSQIPCEIADRLADRVSVLMLDKNNFKDLSFLVFFGRLQHLFLNKNTNPSWATLPFMPHLISLHLNGCHLIELFDWIQQIRNQCPKIQFLSMKTSYFRKTRVTPDDAINRRRTIINMLPGLTYLDGVPISELEREQAKLYQSIVSKKKINFCFV